MYDDAFIFFYVILTKYCFLFFLGKKPRKGRPLHSRRRNQKNSILKTAPYQRQQSYKRPTPRNNNVRSNRHSVQATQPYKTHRKGGYGQALDWLETPMSYSEKSYSDEAGTEQDPSSPFVLLASYDIQNDQPGSSGYYAYPMQDFLDYIFLSYMMNTFGATPIA